MTLKRLELLQWFALFGGGVAWAAMHLLEFGIGNADCAVAVARWSVPTTVLHLLVASLAGALVLAAAGGAFVVLRETSDVGEYDPGPHGRLRFFAQAALLGNLLFLMLVLLDVVGALSHSCRQA